LRGEIRLPMYTDRIFLHELVDLIAQRMLEVNESRDLMSQERVNAVLKVLPTIAEGLDLNVYFDGVDKYEFTEQVAVFDALKVDLLHGWIYDAHDADLGAVIPNKSFNHLQFQLLEYQNLNEKLLGTGDENGNKIEELNFENLALEQQKLYYEGRIIERFLTETASQLTYSGLIKLYEFLTDRHLAVFFRNNHFSTLFFYQGQIFLLVTDFGFIDQSDVVWELVSNISG
jgi:ubiquitin carboxyl-terminal hydrolase MINDY-1/2